MRIASCRPSILRCTGEALDGRTVMVLSLLDRLYGAAVVLTGSAGTAAEDLTFQTVARAMVGIASSPSRPAELMLHLHQLMAALYGDVGDAGRPATSVTAEAFADQPASLSDVEIDDLSADEVRTALLSLPRRWRMAVLYVDVEGFSYAAGAALMDCTASELAAVLYYARQLLRMALSAALRARTVN